jgi:hypothetical protein
MSKYDALGAYLRAQGADVVPMTFAEVERVVGAKLPKSQKQQAWWSNSTSNNVMTQVWLDAGYRSEQVDVVGRKLVFRRVANPVSGMQEEPSMFRPSDDSTEKKPFRSPLFGAMKGTFTIEPGYDLTKPVYTEAEWTEIENEILAKFDRAFADRDKRS